MKIVPISVKLIHATPNPLTIIETTGRICYQSEPKGDPDKFVRMLIKRGHESVLEHVSAGLSLTVDRGVTHETVRHRIAAFSQESTRFCNYIREAFGSEITVIEPEWHKHTSHAKWEKLVLFAEATYAELVADGEPPELARSVLPTCLKAEIGMTANAREWRHILRLRLSPKAHPQMRQVMALVAKELMAWCPVLFEDMVTL